MKLPKLQSGIAVVSYDAEDNTVMVILPEGMRVFVMPADSGLCLVPSAVPVDRPMSIEIGTMRDAPPPELRDPDNILADEGST